MPYKNVWISWTLVFTVSIEFLKAGVNLYRKASSELDVNLPQMFATKIEILVPTSRELVESAASGPGWQPVLVSFQKLA